MRQIEKRNDFAELLTEMGLTGWAAEVGVAEGYFSFNMLENWTGNLVMVDPWKILDTPGFTPHGEATDADQEARYQRVLHAVKKWPGRAHIHRATSEEASKRFEDGFFDFIFLDGNHIYEQVVNDLNWWHRKLKSGAVFSGHDHLSGLVGGVDYGVERAVKEFAHEHGYTVNVTKELDYPSWYLQVN